MAGIAGGARRDRRCRGAWPRAARTREDPQRRSARTGLLERFEGRIFSATDVEHGKPAPDLFLHAARAMGAEPRALRRRRGRARRAPRPGRRAGMDVLGYAGLTAPELLEAEGARVFRSMAELPALLNGSAPR